MRNIMKSLTNSSVRISLSQNGLILTITHQTNCLTSNPLRMVARVIRAEELKNHDFHDEVTQVNLILVCSIHLVQICKCLYKSPTCYNDSYLMPANQLVKTCLRLLPLQLAPHSHHRHILPLVVTQPCQIYCYCNHHVYGSMVQKRHMQLQIYVRF